jgi:uncharacterized protein (TIGR03437 family)
MFNSTGRNGLLASCGVICSIFLMSAPVWAQPSIHAGRGVVNASYVASASAERGPKSAVINTTLTVTDASGSLGAAGATFAGKASFTNIGDGAFTGTMGLSPTAAGNLNGIFTVTLNTSGDKLNGTISVPTTALSGGAYMGSATITGGTGAYAGAVGSFPLITGTLAIGLNISLTFTGVGTITTGGAVGPPTPAITEVLDAASYTKDLAQGSIFVVKGSNLSASGFTQMSFPLPTASGGVSIKFAAPGTGASGQGTSAYLVYLYNLTGVNQLAAVVPSTLAVGTYDVAVTYNNTTGTIPGVRVVQRKPELITADSTGSGLAVVQNYISAAQLDIDRLTTFSASGFTFSPSKPGQTLIAWATGFGPVSGSDNTASPGFDFSTNGVNVQVIVGGMSIKPLYAGRAPGLAGADQINFTLPANVPTGCTVSFQVSMNGVLSNTTFIAIAPDANATACVQPGFTTAQLQQYDNGASFTTGYFALAQFTQTLPQVGAVKINSASGGFTRFTGFQLAGLAQAQAQVTTSGACYVTHSVSSTQTTAIPSTGRGLDAGSVTINGPAASGLSNKLLNQDPNSYTYSLNLGIEGGLSIPGSINASLVAGSYTVNGAGGKDVGRFNATVNLGASLNVTGGLPATVVRSAGLPLSWTGGNASDLVQIIGSSGTTTGTGANTVVDSWLFVCTTNAGAGSFTVPASVLTQLPASATGSLFVASGAVSTFSAPLTAGGNIDNGAFVSFVGTGATPAYQ